MKIVIYCFAFLFFFAHPLTSSESSVSEIFLKRHSGKMFDPSQKVTQEKLHALVDAARWAPSSNNDQPWNFIFCDRDLSPEAYATVLSSLKPKNQVWAANAPLLVVITARSQTIYKNKPNPWAEYDTGAAAVSMALQASELGLMTHQIGGFETEVVSKAFHLPENVKPLVVMVIGGESKESDPDAKPRDRYPEENNFFLGDWGVPLFAK
jgi:nitroreductase